MSIFVCRRFSGLRGQQLSYWIVGKQIESAGLFRVLHRKCTGNCDSKVLSLDLEPLRGQDHQLRLIRQNHSAQKV